jgi:hypothetical protein
VFSGADGSTLYTVFGDAHGDQFGAASSDAGDVDGDCSDDFLVGAELDDDNAPDCGSARVFLGPVTATAPPSSTGPSIVSLDPSVVGPELNGATVDSRESAALAVYLLRFPAHMPVGLSLLDHTGCAVRFDEFGCARILILPLAAVDTTRVIYLSPSHSSMLGVRGVVLQAVCFRRGAPPTVRLTDTVEVVTGRD